MRVTLSTSASARLEVARQFLLDAPPAAEFLIVGASRGAADDLARTIALVRGATFGLYRFSLTQLAARLAAPLLARDGLAPTTALGAQAVAARALFDATRDSALSYFAPVAASPGFPRALARTLEELAAAMVPAAAIRGLGEGGRDLAALFYRFDYQFESASAVHRAQLIAKATRAVEEAANPYAACRLLLLDVAIANATERAFVEALVARAPEACATTPEGDDASRRALEALGRLEVVEPSEARGLNRLRRYLFSAATPPLVDPIGPMEDVELFSAPGEGRESVEIARRVLREARRGVPFDRMAIALRAPEHYAGPLEHALRRADVPMYFERGTRRPHPAGRAFLALLRCAIDNLSARRFAEYLSLGQAPDASDAGIEGGFTLSSDEVFGVAGERAQRAAEEHGPSDSNTEERDSADRQVFRAPWRWERLLAESRVVATEQRWERRLAGLVNECELQKTELARAEPESPRINHLTRKIEDIRQLAAFALPIMRMLGEWPVRATWGEWLARFDRLAPRVLKRPNRVLRVLADLRPMSAIGPIGLDEAAEVLADRLASIEAEPPARRYGSVLVTTPAQLRGLSFDVVFVPALAERMFPQKPREDPLLLDDARTALAAGEARATLPTQTMRAELEKLQLRLAVGAAGSRLYVSFPTVEVGNGRPRVPSLYALEVWRAMTGRVPSADELQQTALRASHATLAWPAPANRDEAIDPLEHDLATLRGLMAEPEHRARGRAQYMLQLSECLQRSVRERYMRARRSWSHWDGLTTATDRLKPVLDSYRLGVRTYSLSALQKYSVCPYQFLLGAIYRMRPAEDLEPLERMDPLTRGSLFHAVQTEFYRRLRTRGDLPVTVANRDRALMELDDSLAQIATGAYEQLAPAVDRVWEEAIAAIRRDLRLWVDQVVHAGGEWIPKWFEWSFGLKDAGRDEASRSEEVAIDGRFRLHGSIDLIEERANGDLRVTDHKTGRYRGKDRMIIGGGAVLQPVLYSMALEIATARPVVEGRLCYATSAGGYRDVSIPLTPQARRLGVEALEIIDRAIETGFLAPAPVEKACTWCDFRPVCGPAAERRISRFKSHEPLADLLELRSKP